jgi:hypothetical protein
LKTAILELQSSMELEWKAPQLSPTPPNPDPSAWLQEWEMELIQHMPTYPSSSLALASECLRERLSEIRLMLRQTSETIESVTFHLEDEVKRPPKGFGQERGNTFNAHDGLDDDSQSKAPPSDQRTLLTAHPSNYVAGWQERGKNSTSRSGSRSTNRSKASTPRRAAKPVHNWGHGGTLGKASGLRF